MTDKINSVIISRLPEEIQVNKNENMNTGPEKEKLPAQSEEIQNQSSEHDSEPKKKKNPVGLWIFAAACFLFLIIGMSVYFASPKNSSNNVEMRSVTLLDAGFDTPIIFQAECTEDEFNTYSDIVETTFKHYNELFDNYNTYDDAVSIMEVNEKAASEPVTVDEHVIDVINEAMEAHEVNPKFDIAQGKLLALWHDAREADPQYVPADEDIQAAISSTGMNGLIIDGNTIAFADDSIALDLGAIAKGYTAQICADQLEEAGLDNGFINAGGNVVLIGTKASGDNWKVGIQDPASSNSLVVFETGTPCSLVTSGDYQRYMEVDGVRYSHIIDPDSGYPETYMRSVTVIADDSGFADAMSTALFCMSVEDGMQVAEDEGFNAIWIVDEGTVDKKPDLSAKGFDIYVTDGIRSQVSLSKYAAGSEQ